MRGWVLRAEECEDAPVSKGGGLHRTGSTASLMGYGGRCVRIVGVKPLTAAVRDAAFCQVVRAHLHLDLVTDVKADEVFPHFARDMRQDFVAIDKLDTKGCAFHDRFDFTFNFDGFACHNNRISWLV